MRRRVKFNKEMYVAALDKINVPSNGSYEKDAQHLDHIYKERIMNNETIDTMAGADVNDCMYDRQMLKHENMRKLILSFAMLVLGIVMTAVFVFRIASNIYLKNAGQKFTLDYVDESEYCRRTDEKTGLNSYDGYASVIWHSENVYDTVMIYAKTYGEVSLFYMYSRKDYAEISRLNITVNDSYVDTLMQKGFEPAEIVASVNGDISGKYELKRGQSVDIYYLPQKGESIKSLRVPENIIRYIVYTIVVLIYCAFWLRRVIRIGIEEKRLDRSFAADN